jgi:hypothetical protein
MHTNPGSPPVAEDRTGDRTQSHDEHEPHNLLGSTMRCGGRRLAVNGRGWDRTSDPSRVKRVLSL